MTVVAGRTVGLGNCFKICVGDLKRKCTIETRSISGQNFGVTKPSMNFTVLFTGYFLIQTVKGTKRFSGVNIEKEATHIFVCRWRSSINNLDGAGGNFIRQSDKLYRVLEVTNINEESKYLLFQCAERGIDTNEETNA